MPVLFALLLLAGAQVADVPANPSPLLPSDEPPPAAASPPPADEDPRAMDDDADSPRGKRRRDHSENADEEGFNGAAQEGPGGAVTGLASGAAAAGAMAGAGTLLMLASPILSVLSVFPVIGWLMGCTSCIWIPAGIGSLGGLTAWALANWVGKRRVPVLPLMGTAVGIMCGGFALGGLVQAVLAGPAYLLNFVALTGDDETFLLGTLGSWAGFTCAGVCGMMCWLSACGTAAGTLGAMAAMMGRQMADHESGLTFDAVSVPSPSLESDEDDREEEERPRPRKKVRRRATDEEFDDE